MTSIDNILNKFKNFNILVLGDVMIDQYINGHVERISPEAPVPIVTMNSIENRLGGAGNVAMNLKSLGANVLVCSIVGNDSGKESIFDLFNKNDISTKGLLVLEDRKTTIKTRVVSNKQQLVRIDQEDIEEINNLEEKKLLALFNLLILENIDAVIFEDYNKGVLTENIIKKTIEKCNELNIPTAVDPKKNNFFAYKNATIFKPNLKELREGLNIGFSQPINEQLLVKSVERLNEKLNHQITLITLSENGIFIGDGSSCYLIPAHVRNISDVSGAGDTVISVAVLCFLANSPLKLIGQISNIAGGMVCEIPGVARITTDDLKKECNKLSLL